ncbi:MAG: Rid family detoxifying hydrolase [Firmicutes bacterium]|nr:Rid family detoxifying hydrolase [Bacillota bacterium]
MDAKVIRTGRAPIPGGAYSQGLIVGGFLFTAGVGPIDPTTGRVVGNTITEQTRQVLTNLRAILEESGLDFADVVKTTVHLQDIARDFAEFNRTYETFFVPPYPVRTTVGSVLPGILVEIDMIAWAGPKSRVD